MKRPHWYEFQEEIKNHFISLGVQAETNVTIKGVKTSHDIDILVTSKFLGQNIKWIVEAKHWKKNVPKLHVIALKNIVEETGCDKGFIISQTGFQKGAIEASVNSNITLLKYEDFINQTTRLIESKILNTYFERLIILQTRYWSHSKDIRMEYGLRRERHDFEPDFSVQFIIFAIKNALQKGLKNNYPFLNKTSLPIQFGESNINNFNELINWLNINFNVLDRKIIEAEIEMQKNGQYSPILTEIYSR